MSNFQSIANGHLSTIKSKINSLSGDINTDALNIHGTTHAKLDLNFGKLSNIQTITDQKLSAIQTFLDKDSGTNFHNALTNAKLDTIATNTANIKIEADSIDLNLDSLEVKMDHLSSDLDGITAKLPSALNSDNLKVIDSALDTAIGSMDINNQNKLDHLSGDLDTIEATLTNIETDIAANEVLHTATNALLTGIDADTNAIKIDVAANEVLLGTINTNIAVVKDCVASDKVNVNISSGSMDLATGAATATHQTTGHSKLDHLSDNLDTLEATLTNIETDIAANEVLITASNALLTTIDADTNNIKIDVAALEVLQTATNGLLTTIDEDTNNIKIDVAALEVLQTATNGLLTTIDEDTNNIKDLLTGIDEDTNNIKTDIAALEVLQTATNTLLTGIDADTNDIKVDVAALEVLQTATNGLLTTIDADTNDIKTDVAALEVLQTATNGLLTTIDADTDAIKTDIAALEVLHGTTNTKLADIDGVLDSIKVDTTLLAGVSEAVWLNNITLGAGALSAHLDTTGYTKIRIYGVSDAAFDGSGPSDLLVMGALTSGGTYYNQFVYPTQLSSQTKSIGGSNVISVSMLFDNPPKFLKILNNNVGVAYSGLTFIAKMTRT